MSDHRPAAFDVTGFYFSPGLAAKPAVALTAVSGGSGWRDCQGGFHEIAEESGTGYGSCRSRSGFSAVRITLGPHPHRHRAAGNFSAMISRATPNPGPFSALDDPQATLPFSALRQGGSGDQQH